MDHNKIEIKTKGESVLEQIGAVKEATKALNSATEDSVTDKEEVFGWITLIGKAILSIFR